MDFSVTIFSNAVLFVSLAKRLKATLIFDCREDEGGNSGNGGNAGSLDNDGGVMGNKGTDGTDGSSPSTYSLELYDALYDAFMQYGC